MWERVKKAFDLWLTLGQIIGVFALGSAAAIFFLDRFAAKDDVGEAAGHLSVRIVEMNSQIILQATQMNSRMDRIVTFIKEQVAYLSGDQANIKVEIATQYRAINTRLDAQNALLIQVLKDREKRDGSARNEWTILPNAQAAK